MPRTDKITIPLVDLDNIIKIIADKKPAGGIVTIIDLGTHFTVRDAQDFLIGGIEKVNNQKEPS